MVFVVAFAGKIGSGKTTLSTAISRATGCKRASFGDYVRHVVSTQGLETTRETLQRVGTEILTANPLDFCKNVLAHSGWISGESLVIDGLRHSETIPLLNDLFSPLKLQIVYIDIDELLRFARLGVKGDREAAAQAVADSHSSEQQVATTLRDIADLIVDGRSPIQDSVAQVLGFLSKK
jgi:dephospho-CoA kinase